MPGMRCDGGRRQGQPDACKDRRGQIRRKHGECHAPGENLRNWKPPPYAPFAIPQASQYVTVVLRASSRERRHGKGGSDSLSFCRLGPQAGCLRGFTPPLSPVITLPIRWMLAPKPGALRSVSSIEWVCCLSWLQTRPPVSSLPFFRKRLSPIRPLSCCSRIFR